MHFDEILNHIGTFGRYQKMIFFFVCVFSLPMSYHQFAQVFLAPDTAHWCATPQLTEPNCSLYSKVSDDYSLCLEERKNLSIPRDEKGKFDGCLRYRHFGEEDALLYENETEGFWNETIGCDAGWEYDRSQYHTTVVQDFDVVCDQKNIPEMAQSLFFAGVLVSSLISGFFADWLGRHRTLFLCLGFQFIFSLVTVFAPTMSAFIVLRFFLAVSNMGVYIMAFVIGTELVGPEWRTFIGVCAECAFAMGYMLLAVVAYFVRDWRTLQLIGAIPIAAFFLLIRVIPESARWLITQGRLAEAEVIIRKIAKVNKAKLPEQLFSEADRMQVVVRRSFIDLFRTPNLRKRTFNVMFNWFVNAAVYYGLSLSTSNLGTDDYLAFFIGGFVEIPACIAVLLTIDRFGRRFILFLSLLLGGISCLATIFIEAGAGRTTVAMIGKFGISASFLLIYIFSAEIFPTPVRSIGIGLSSMCARFGSIMAPPLLVLRSLWEPLPLLVFGCLAVLASFLSLLLPETLGLNMPETIKQGEEMGAGVPFRLPHWRGWKHGQGVTRDDDKTYKPVDTNQNGKSDDISGDERGSKDDGCKVDEDEGKVGNALV
ncbi:organic cation transporter protein-like [Asterias rubens]|uniref:organic cation transporter protein-like n=1 Tax=Asterias rubens TaxID=7604 RepID=UPI001455B430|nr:organic cation transporter protein-like [Asterias rubens]